MYSGEALESRNKSARKFRENHARKFSREANINDVYKRALSDYPAGALKLLSHS